VVLTDGETAGEERCRQLARQAAANNVPLTLMGVGLDWKASLLKELATLSQGKWYYIDVQEARATTRIFAAEFDALAATAFLDVTMHLRPVKDVRVKRVRQVMPEIRDIPFEEGSERELLTRLGTLQRDVSTRYILDLSLPRRPDGKYAIAQLELTYDLGTGQRASSGSVPLEIVYTAAGNGPANAEVMKHIDDIQLKGLSDELQEVLQNNNQQTAQRIAEEILEKGKQMGPRAARKTKLAEAVLSDLAGGRTVDKKTKLALDDEARRSE
jgi:hypothetical protein